MKKMDNFQPTQPQMGGGMGAGMTPGMGSAGGGEQDDRAAIVEAAKKLKQLADQYGMDLSPIFAKGKRAIPPPPVATNSMG
jgi:hypothetical protein